MSCFGKGISTRSDRVDPVYSKWYEMLRRVYSENYHKQYPTYRNVKIHEPWNCFSNFKEWADDKYFEGCVLDKDILSGQIKTYSPDTCCFIPERINLLFLIPKKKIKSTLPIGVTVDPRKKEGTRRFVARVGCSIGRKNTHLGMFYDPIDAHIAWQAGKCDRIDEELVLWKNHPSYNQRVADAIIGHKSHLEYCTANRIVVKSIYKD